ncbi:unnamed protein product [Oppiella nova]|uniref:Uncharacterized protein n=1 Tax=Oppiella nova TaxID=334625 RepID=A0A7R9LHV3_9ACAR|nr:unnamed protein product [Oppiella nova]CAG2163816.1 unnamed protein product [Oppiella nova]
MGSEFLGKRADGFYKVKKMGSEFLGRRRRNVEISSDIYGSQKPKRMSEYLWSGVPDKRLSEFLGGPGKRRIGGAVTPSYYLAKKLSEYLNSSFKRPVRFSNAFLDFYNPRGSEFLGGPGKK